MGWPIAGSRSRRTGSSIHSPTDYNQQISPNKPQEEYLEEASMSVKSVMLATAAVIAMTAPAMAQTKVPVGHLADYSGATSDVGVPFGQGVADALAYINKTGGVGGSQMGVETFDYGYQVPRAISQYKKWSG